ncbi:xylulokinase [Thaumasiovibrio sp. DFM-14]|uniref:xylulokinase n=1 Tax=Thaumasiovibrio sp. DFM-14 TaxID=3384792 RepID=UPI0039A2BD09
MYIGIDCGTQGTKAIVWQDDQIIGQGYTPHTTIMKLVGQREQSPNAWFEALVTSIQLAFNGIEHHKAAIKGIGVSGQQHGLVLLDENDNVIRDALLWCDNRPHDVFSDFQTSNELNFVDSIGIQVPVAYTIGKLLWVKKNDQASYQKIRKIMLPHDYLNWRLTGRFTIEPGDASGSGWFDTRSKSINQDLLKLIGIHNQLDLPEVIDSKDVVAKITPNIAQQLGLNNDVIVSSGGGDNMMAAIGTGNIDTGQLTLSLGTSGTVFSHCHQQIDSKIHPDLNAFCSSSNGYLPLASTMNLTTANNQVLNLINKDIGEFDQMLNASPIGADGMLCLPFFNGARLPNVPNANGAILGITANNLSPTNLFKATVEGVTFKLQRAANVLQDAGIACENACVIGGGAKSAAWRQMIADMLNLPLWTPQSSEAAAIGAALQACWAYENQYQETDISTICRESITVDASKTVSPNPSNVASYKELSAQYHDTVDNYMAQFR